MMDTIQPCDKCHTVHDIQYDCENPPAHEDKANAYITALIIACAFVAGGIFWEVVG